MLISGSHHATYFAVDSRTAEIGQLVPVAGCFQSRALKTSGAKIALEALPPLWLQISLLSMTWGSTSMSSFAVTFVSLVCPLAEGWNSLSQEQVKDKKVAE